MHKDVLSKNQISLVPLLSHFSDSFTLVGGTAIALQLGHRSSIDFDLFTDTPFDSLQLRAQLSEKYTIQQTIIDSEYELTVIVDGVKLTFYKYPFKIEGTVSFENHILMPNLSTLAAMKAFALGKRAKWKDYVDLYFVFKKLGYESVINATEAIFKAQFNEKLFRVQLSYFDDIDYTEEVDFLIANPPTDEDVRRYLREIGIG